MKTQLIVVTCVIIALCGCGKKEKKTVQNTPFSGEDYSLKFPDTWEIKDRGFMGTDLMGLSPTENPQDTFRENVNVVLENISASMSDEEYLKLSLTSLNKIFGVPSDRPFGQAKVGHHQGYHLRYSAQMGQIKVDNDIYIVLQKGAAYIITCSNLKGKRDTFKPIMDSIVETFQIK